MKDSYVFYKNKLNVEYKPVFEQVEMYVLTQNIDDSTAEERLGDLLDIFLSSQNAGKPVRNIVGTNLERFCKTFCSDFGLKNRIFRILDWLKNIAWVLVVISGLDILWLFLDTTNIDEVDLWHLISTLDISMYFSYVIIFVTLFFTTNIVVRHIMFKTKRISMGVLNTIICIEAVVSSTGIFMLINFNNIKLFDTPTWIVALISTLYLVTYYLLFGKRINRQKVKFSDLVENDLTPEFSATMEKRFEKAKKKNLKKGKGELTLEAFLDSEERLNNRTEKQRLFYKLLPIGLTALSYVTTALSSGFETFTDSIIYVLVMLSVECPLLWGLWKIFKSGIDARRAWIKARRNELEQKTGKQINI